ncbi:hypothetical protein JKP88DRAFT_347383 [Tribonema minus]|uniref:NAD(P)-binding domain-containing protein n=1 Tax=Tribonema minus TaxID=303371 RepID=A0A836CQH2_9STRA|nr:hypothetical protein JKP88DRAFT_347383 [Tribonema minus]
MMCRSVGLLLVALGWAGCGCRGFSVPASLSMTESSSAQGGAVPLISVAGGSGRVGRLAVKRVLEMYPEARVRAVVRDAARAKDVLSEELTSQRLEVVKADLSTAAGITAAVKDCSAMVWCATSFSDASAHSFRKSWAQRSPPVQRIFNLAAFLFNPDNCLEAKAVPAAAAALAANGAPPYRLQAPTPAPVPEQPPKKGGTRPSLGAKGGSKGGAGGGDGEGVLPRFVLLSSAAVTRPAWSAAEKEEFKAAAQIPIVKLNPFKILDLKRKGEEALRRTAVPYTIVRPCGLNDKQAPGRLIVSAGDVAAGRICRADVAEGLAACLSEPLATAKTFEMFALPGLSKAPVGPPIGSLPTDAQLSSPDALQAVRRGAYGLLSQLRPVQNFDV